MGIVDQVTCSEVKLALFLHDASRLELPAGVLIWAARAVRGFCNSHALAAFLGVPFVYRDACQGGPVKPLYPV